MSSSSQPEASDLGVMVGNQLVIPNPLDLGALTVTTGNSAPVGGYSVLTNAANWSGSMTRQFLPWCSKTFFGCPTFMSPSSGVDCAALVSDILFGTFSWSKIHESFRFYPFGRDIPSVSSCCLWGIPNTFP
jgi:hypothetical protein